MNLTVDGERDSIVEVSGERRVALAQPGEQITDIRCLDFRLLVSIDEVPEVSREDHARHQSVRQPLERVLPPAPSAPLAETSADR